MGEKKCVRVRERERERERGIERKREEERGDRKSDEESNETRDLSPIDAYRVGGNPRVIARTSEPQFFICWLRILRWFSQASAVH